MSYLIDQLNSLHKTARARWVSEILRNPGLRRRVKASVGSVTDSPEGIRGLKSELAGYNARFRLPKDALDEVYDYINDVEIQAVRPLEYEEWPGVLQRLNVRNLPIKKTDRNTLMHTPHVVSPDRDTIKANTNLDITKSKGTYSLIRRFNNKPLIDDSPWYETVLNNDLQKLPSNFKIEDHLEYLIPSSVRTPHAIRASLLPTNPERFIYKGTAGAPEAFLNRLPELNTKPSWWSAYPEVAHQYNKPRKVYDKDAFEAKKRYYISSKSPEGRKILSSYLKGESDLNGYSTWKQSVESSKRIRRKFILDRLNPEHPSFSRYFAHNPVLSTEKPRLTRERLNRTDLQDRLVAGGDMEPAVWRGLDSRSQRG